MENAEEREPLEANNLFTHFNTTAVVCSQECSTMDSHNGELLPTPSSPFNSSDKPAEENCSPHGLPLTSKGNVDAKFYKKEPPNTSSIEKSLLTHMVVAGNEVDPSIQLLDGQDYSELSDQVKEACEEISCTETDKTPSLMNRQLKPCSNITTIEKSPPQLNEGPAKQKQNSEEKLLIKPFSSDKNVKPTISQESAVGNIQFLSQSSDRKVNNGRMLSKYKHKRPPNVCGDFKSPSLLEVAVFLLTWPSSIMFNAMDCTIEEKYIPPLNACLPPYEFPYIRGYTTSWEPPVSTTMNKSKHKSLSVSGKETVHYPTFSSHKQPNKETSIQKCYSAITTEKIYTEQLVLYPSSPTKLPNMDSWYRQWKITFSVKLQIIIGERRLSTHKITAHQLVQVTALYHQNNVLNCTLIFLKVILKSSCYMTLPLEVVHCTHHDDDDTVSTYYCDQLISYQVNEYIHLSAISTTNEFF